MNRTQRGTSFFKTNPFQNSFNFLSKLTTTFKANKSSFTTRTHFNKLNVSIFKRPITQEEIDFATAPDGFLAQQGVRLRTETEALLLNPHTPFADNIKRKVIAARTALYLGNECTEIPFFFLGLRLLWNSSKKTSPETFEFVKTLFDHHNKLWSVTGHHAITLSSDPQTAHALLLFKDATLIKDPYAKLNLLDEIHFLHDTTKDKHKKYLAHAIIKIIAQTEKDHFTVHDNAYKILKKISRKQKSQKQQPQPKDKK